MTIAPGLNVTLEAAGTTTVTVSSSLSSVSSQLSSFVTAYNAAFTEVQKNFGQNGGALVGDSTVLGMQQALQQMISYTRIERVHYVAGTAGRGVYPARHADVQFVGI